MGNCQAVDNASLVLQTQNGKAEKFYSPVSAAEIMKLHPGHCVALLLTTTLYSPPPSSDNHHHHHHQPPNQQPLRVTRIKLLRPTDNLLLGHAYRLLTNQEVMKGLKAKKNGKADNYKKFHQSPESAGKAEAKPNSDQTSAATGSNQLGKVKTHQHEVAIDPQRKVDKVPAAPAKCKPPSRSKSKPARGWHPSLNSISEAAS